MEKFAFIGTGRMGSAIIQALLNTGRKPETIWAVDREIHSHLAAFGKQGVRIGTDNQAAAAWAEGIFLCVKPQQIQTLLAEIAPLLADKLVVSIAAGIPLSLLEQYAKGAKAVVRVMPNTPMLLGKGVAGLAASQNADPKAVALAREVFALSGQAFLVPEAQLDGVTALSGSGPAYFYEIVKILAEKAAGCGIEAETALAMAIGTMSGAAAMLAETKQSPQALIDQVASPNGTTEAALHVLAAEGLADVLAKGFDAAAARSKALAAEFAESKPTSP